MVQLYGNLVFSRLQRVFKPLQRVSAQIRNDSNCYFWLQALVLCTGDPHAPCGVARVRLALNFAARAPERLLSELVCHRQGYDGALGQADAERPVVSEFE